jgi:hypothetical protein
MRRAAALCGFLGALVAQGALLAGCYTLIDGAAAVSGGTILAGGVIGFALMAAARRIARPETSALDKDSALAPPPLTAQGGPQQSAA